MLNLEKEARLAYLDLSFVEPLRQLRQPAEQPRQQSPPIFHSPFPKTWVAFQCPGLAALILVPLIHHLSRGLLISNQEIKNDKNMDDSETSSRRKVRSPSFPFIGLREALERARGFYEAEQRNAARPETAAAHWGYSPKSSGGKQTTAALRAFRLLEGDTLVKLSGRALRILLDEREGSEDRDRLL